MVSDHPECFETARQLFGPKIKNWGFLPSKEDYYQVLQQADICVSTANHEFCGVSMLEGALSDCFCLVPNRLSYVELFPDECKYNTDKQLAKKLKNLVNAGKCRIKKITEDLKLKDKILPLVDHEIVLKTILQEIKV